ncbi:hypothetical protein [Nitrincola sp. MINF-07-Sa-05]|uniref:hypothetical protein n=1 Tax=Nitrincola salilacus TaxID=3400273 RepID=UPI0039184EAF
MNHQDTQETNPVRSGKEKRRAVVRVALTLLLSALLSALILVLDSRISAERHANELASDLARTSAILVQPLLLSNDRISLNYLINEITAQQMIGGIRLTDANRTVLATAGEQQGDAHTIELVRGDELLGELMVWSNPEPVRLMIQRQQWLAALLALLTSIAGLISLWLALRPPSPARQTPADTQPRFEEVMQSVTEDERDSIPVLTDTLYRQPVPQEALKATAPEPHAETEADQPVTLTDATPVRSPATEPTAAPPANEASYDSDLTEPAPIHDEDEIPDLDMHDTAPETAPETTPETTPNKGPAMDMPSDSEPDSDDDPLFTSTQEIEEEELDNEALVSLLKPERERYGSMPAFSPSGRQQSEGLDDDPALDIFELDEMMPEPQPTEPARPNPLMDAGEEQLDLYRFEQDLELLLSPEEAGYLFLIDSTSAHAEHVDEADRQHLLKTYRLLANSVAVIYSGRVEPVNNGDLQLIFDKPEQQDAHGVNAMCAAMLFTHLYKQYNQSRIRLFSPVLNLHMALVRGHRQKLDRLLEEARFLTRTTQTNELISHTGLTEAPDLKSSLLSGASIRREDEDKVLVLQIGSSYQELLEKQARHLLTKLNNRNKPTQGSR